jgi:hypothetical protein
MPSPIDPMVVAFLQRSMVAQVATRSAKGRPFMTPLWFVVDGGVLYITTGPETRTGKNIIRHPEVVMLLSGERGRKSDQVLRLRGTATCHRGLPGWRVLLRIAAKYYASPGALRVELRNAGRWHLRQLYYGQALGGFGHIRVVPTAADFVRVP